MKNLVKNFAAIFCLVSMGTYSMNSRGLNEIPTSSRFAERAMLRSDTLVSPNSRVEVVPDWTKAPNSYVFDPIQSGEGLLVPVRKAYAMWKEDKYIKDGGIPAGPVTADVLWEDTHGLIKSGPGYSLEIMDSDQNAKIKVPINKTKKGNAVIVMRVNNEIYWSWHIWVTDDPTKGSVYKSFDSITRMKTDGTVEPIPDSDWQWMDRNLGALSNSITSSDWNRSIGLLYQWGRKDPIPPLVTRGNDFYEVSGSVGRVRHRGAKNFNGAVSIDNLTRFVSLANAEIGNNMRISVKNPLSLIYVNKDDNSGQAYYNNNLNLPVNWFGRSANLPDNRLSELNLWSDNSVGTISTGYNNDSQARPYRDKSPYDPCPNGWRIPSMLVANLGSQSYIDDIRIDFSPFGVRTNMAKNVFETNKYHIIKPNDTGTPAFMTGFRIYPNLGFDLSNVGGNNMGIFPGTGQLIRNAHLGQYTDQHHTALWTATMARHFDASPAVSVRGLYMIPDKGQPDIPDPNYPAIKGRYFYMPMSGMYTSEANGCRCIKDPLYIVDRYDFPSEYLAPPMEYREGMYNPNTYQSIKNTQPYTIQIPVSKAFSVQSQLLNNQEILNPSSFNNLKANVLWTTNTVLINRISVVNPSPSSLQAIGDTKISVEITPNQSGNAVVTLHNGSIASPVYWSWHIWITDSSIGSFTYTTEAPVADAVNYVNYVSKADVVLQTEFMDRNLGAVETFPMVANALTPTTAELAKIRASTGLHYQWGRKDPIPTFQYADNKASFNVFLGSATDSGTIAYSTLTPAIYNNMSGSYIVPYNAYAAASNVQIADRPADKIAKVLSYSVKNPLVYMIPSSFAPYNSTIPNYTNGTDWLADEPNLAPDRWGRGGEKSPFDPCPEGWRIPDITTAALISNQDFGQSPWYKKDKNVATFYSVSADYSGFRVRNPSTTSTIGYMFVGPSYIVGNFPDSGSRGFRSVLANQSPQGTFNTVNFQYPGVWTGALAANYLGRSINVLFDAAATANRFIAFNDNNDPYLGTSCRCVRVKYDAGGNEAGPIPELQVAVLASGKQAEILSSAEVKEKVVQNSISFFPNPVKDVLHINAPEENGYYYQVYNMSGQIVKKGKFENGKTDLSTLTSGIYLIRINDSEKMVKIIKQ
ncbi:Por secretion system C-terminal sorting domain-containing protein [Chryseobacterium carnipullorum]|uniref:T9SS type A sorting domain-containing protein n=1 Tax=Chryseobacterium carnipullorum TaxID=1124835 RepID=UPI00091631D5|nr:T9SS type A sorting domain-containing protein [Chryseobacterium carnipullorum]SHM87275.1 Por secretion system C-terminal sorting domain-containing protein [Chryseobacterium carnipullorum]